MISEPPSVPRVLAFRDDQLVTYVNNEWETLDIQCTVESVYPVHDLEFQLISGDTVVSNRQPGNGYSANSDHTFRVTTVFSVQFSRSYSLTEDGLTCQVYHQRGNSQSQRLCVTLLGEHYN